MRASAAAKIKLKTTYSVWPFFSLLMGKRLSHRAAAQITCYLVAVAPWPAAQVPR